MFGERFQGLLLILLGLASMFLLFLARQSGWLDFRPPVPAGVPVISPLACLLPLAGLGALGLCLVGFKKLVAPDDWRPPKHLD